LKTNGLRDGITGQTGTVGADWRQIDTKNRKRGRG
jgi:hypothetical protein